MQSTGLEGLRLRLKASDILGAVALVLVLDSILIYFSQSMKAVGGLVSLVSLLARLGVYIALFFAFRQENRAEKLVYEKKNGLLRVLQVASILFLVIAVASFLFSLILDAAAANEKNAETLRMGQPMVLKIKYLIDLAGNVFSNINLIGLFAFKMYLDEDRNYQLRNTSLVTTVVIVAHLFVAVAKYLIKYYAINGIIAEMLVKGTSLSDYGEKSIGSSFFNTFANVLVYIAFAVIFFLFELRRKSLRRQIEGIENPQESVQGEDAPQGE